MATPSASDATIRTVGHDDVGLRIEWSDGRIERRTPTWVRHACECHECRGPAGGQRRFEIADLDPGLRIGAVAVRDGHIDVETISAGEAHHGVVDPASISRRSPSSSISWDATYGEDLRRRAIDASDPESAALAPMLEAISTHGLALARSLPPRSGEVLRFVERFGYVRETNYGRLFDVVAMPDPANLANSALGLSPHTDNPYRDPVPTVQILHCLTTSGRGGNTAFVDGRRAADRLATVDRRSFEVLRTTPVTFRYTDDTVDLLATGPLIETVGDTVVGVRVNNRSMEPPDLPTEEQDGFYHAYRAFIALLSEPAATVTLSMEPGDVFVFDNRRVLHGRTSYEASGHHAPGERHLQGCYADIDAIRSSVRRLSTTTESRA